MAVDLTQHLNKIVFTGGNNRGVAVKRIGLAVLSAVILVIAALNAAYFASTSGVPDAPYDSLLTEPSVQFARQYLASIKAHNWKAVQAVTDQKILGADPAATFDTMANLIPTGQPTVHVTGVNTVKSPDLERVYVTLEYIFPDKALLTNLVLNRNGNSYLVEGVHVERLTAPLEKYYAFRFLGQDPTHYAIFAGAVLLILFDAFALARCIMMPRLERKWLWIIFILVGFGSLQYNWTDAVFAYQVLTVHIPVVWLTQLSFQPFTIGVSFPLGAILFLLSQRSLVKALESEPGTIKDFSAPAS